MYIVYNKYMKRLFSFLSEKRHLFTWTAIYVFVLWAILKFIFNFSIFNQHQWHRLAHAELHGFAGFVFGLIIFAAIPLYIATCTFIYKKNKPLIEVPVPKCIKNLKNTNKSEPEKPKESNKKTETTEKLPDEVPLEIRPAFERAILNPIKFTKSDETKTEQNTDSAKEQTLPLPDDFDIQLDEAFEDAPITMPKFSDINFDDDTPDDDDAPEDNVQEDITITDTHAIVTHSDPDFWVVDEDNWFATGKTRPSPIAAVLAAAKKYDVKPVIRLTQTNILDIENLIEKWESDGITVITEKTDE